MSIKRRVNRLLAKRGAQQVCEPLISFWEAGKEVTLLDLRGTGITWNEMFESISWRGSKVTDKLKDS
jgi:hypothetical protein